jgi:L-threonylcarbamoyladenylate synthase
LGETIKKASIIRCETEEYLQPAIYKAKNTLLSGGIVAFPTESFYGLAVNISDKEALHRLFKIKERSKDQPVLILIPSIEQLARYVAAIPPIAQALIDKFWPGGLTLVFHARETVSPLLSAGTGKIGIRLSSHPIATALAMTVGKPITGTSANLSGKPPCSFADDVFKELGERIDLILDGGETTGGKGSTILDVTVDPPVIMREGMIGREHLRAFTENIT